MSLVIIPASLYTTITSASVAAFGFNVSTLARFIDITTEIFFVIDIMIHFISEYKDEVDYKPVRDIKKIALKYLRSFFIVDFTATVPLRFIFAGIWTEEFLELCQLLKLMRISKFVKIMDEKNF